MVSCQSQSPLLPKPPQKFKQQRIVNLVINPSRPTPLISGIKSCHENSALQVERDNFCMWYFSTSVCPVSHGSLRPPPPHLDIYYALICSMSANSSKFNSQILSVQEDQVSQRPRPSQTHEKKDPQFYKFGGATRRRTDFASVGASAQIRVAQPDGRVQSFLHFHTKMATSDQNEMESPEESYGELF